MATEVCPERLTDGVTSPFAIDTSVAIKKGLLQGKGVSKAYQGLYNAS